MTPAKTPATTTPATGRRLPTRYLVVAVLALLAVVAGAVGAYALGGGTNLSAKDRIAADPPPALFSDNEVAPTGRRVAAQAPAADRLMRTWWASHGHTRDDRAFAAWAEQVLPPPPSAASRATEIAQVARIAPDRTEAGVAAATWLETYGKKDLWKLYAHDQAELLPGTHGKALKADVKAMLRLSKSVADTLGQRYQQSAPYVVRPTLRPDHTVTKGQVCPCSYPSRHAAAGAAATTYLGGIEPHRLPTYTWTEDEVDWSRIYMAGHVPSDVTAGALLGDLIGEYYLGTRA
jgi:membrane-associated phospholipid phosphatase